MYSYTYSVVVVAFFLYRYRHPQGRFLWSHRNVPYQTGQVSKSTDVEWGDWVFCGIIVPPLDVISTTYE
jgi:hypothetical protein